MPSIFRWTKKDEVYSKKEWHLISRILKSNFLKYLLKICNYKESSPTTFHKSWTKKDEVYSKKGMTLNAKRWIK